MHRSWPTLAIMLGLGLVSPPSLAAEMPSEAQKEAIKSDCRGDFIRHCSGVEPGGLPALECLEKNMASLSQACQTAVKPVEAETGTGG